ncbi:MAG: hypothetical protein AABY87_09185 [bacterium]
MKALRFDGNLRYMTDYPVDQGMDALGKASLPGVLKVLLKID